jgi:hypothetical protein
MRCFNPRSPRRERPTTSITLTETEMICFNPRSPRRERDVRGTLMRCLVSITLPVGSELSSVDVSIHAPRGGSDFAIPQGDAFCSRSEVSIHAPREGSDHFMCPHDYKSVTFSFQSTLPAKGATRSSIGVYHGFMRCFNPRSPWKGATKSITLTQTEMKSFQSTLPAKGATWYDVRYEYGGMLDPVSIHAPREGSDPYQR